jgi:hypothetical protein
MATVYRGQCASDGTRPCEVLCVGAEGPPGGTCVICGHHLGRHQLIGIVLPSNFCEGLHIDLVNPTQVPSSLPATNPIPSNQVAAPEVHTVIQEVLDGVVPSPITHQTITQVNPNAPPRRGPSAGAPPTTFHPQRLVQPVPNQPQAAAAGASGAARRQVPSGYRSAHLSQAGTTRRPAQQRRQPAPRPLRPFRARPPTKKGRWLVRQKVTGHVPQTTLKISKSRIKWHQRRASTLLFRAIIRMQTARVGCKDCI